MSGYRSPTSRIQLIYGGGGFRTLDAPKRRITVFKTGGGEALAKEMNVAFLGRMPIDPQIVASGDWGTPFAGKDMQTQASAAFSQIVPLVLEAVEQYDAAPTR